MFIVALYLPWCKYLDAQQVTLHLYADNLKSVSNDPDVLLGAARFTTDYVRLVRQELVPGKCAAMSASGVARRYMRDWILSHEGEKWTVKGFDRDGIAQCMLANPMSGLTVVLFWTRAVVPHLLGLLCCSCVRPACGSVVDSCFFVLFLDPCRQFKELNYGCYSCNSSVGCGSCGSG